MLITYNDCITQTEDTYDNHLENYITGTLWKNNNNNIKY